MADNKELFAALGVSAPVSCPRCKATPVVIWLSIGKWAVVCGKCLEQTGSDRFYELGQFREATVQAWNSKQETKERLWTS